jgi:hypothetical protein
VGRLRQITNAFDVVGFFLALFLGLWRLLNLNQRLEPLNGWERINPIQIIARLHPYTKTLFLISFGVIAYFFSIMGSKFASITGDVDIIKVLRLDFLMQSFGLAFFILIWLYRANKLSDTPGPIKTTMINVKTKLGMIKQNY